jgi:hypothetical protein
MKHHSPYLPAEALGVEEWERAELIALWPKLVVGAVAIDMRLAASDDGIICCIGGHIALAHGISVLGARRYVQNQAQNGSTLCTLFFPDLTANQRHPGWRATGVQAGRAIFNFLSTGKPDWDHVMATKNAAVEMKKSAVLLAH